MVRYTEIERYSETEIERHRERKRQRGTEWERQRGKTMTHTEKRNARPVYPSRDRTDWMVT